MEANRTGLAGKQVKVIKFLPGGEVGYRWSGKIVAHDEEHVAIEARFNTPTARDLGYVVMEPGDLFIEFYYFHRWFNIYQVYGRDHQPKGWYCNVSTPAELHGDEIHFVDLTLDVFVYPDGRHIVLDREEFEGQKRGLPPHVSQAAEQGLGELLTWVRKARLPSRPGGSGEQVEEG